ncbi:hypothetical protein GIB67_038602 [Kingdonia uniflora]|uniref:Amino acid transporter transmembrane domain-containing protein n=1 Tax=Kingdonia uniflora TaxID=39325 RepID=A0A7J7NPJ1_9MAGN|nr:hypothetical protein GIB67_038602 [Kingdonia uniflora]
MTMGSVAPVKERRSSRKNKQIVDEKAPLLPKNRNGDGGDGFDEFNGALFTGAVFNLSTTIVGAGIMALPATMKVLGLGLGIVMIVFMAFLTEASIEMLLRFSRAGKSVSYGGVMGDAFGRVGRMLLQICVVINNVGVLIVYMIIIGDVLSGTSSSEVHHSGIFEGWFGAQWWNGRFFVLLVTTLAVFAPLACFKRVDSLRYTSALSVALAVVFVVITAGITIVKLLNGSIAMPRWLPDVTDMSAFWKLFTVVPILVTAYICHYNDGDRITPMIQLASSPPSNNELCGFEVPLLTLRVWSNSVLFVASFGVLARHEALAPRFLRALYFLFAVHTIDNELEDSSQIQPIVRTSLVLCSTVYITTSLFGFLLFGDSTLDDVLANFDTNLGIPYSSLLNDAVRVSYAIHLMLVFPIIFFALRLNLDGLIFPSASPLGSDNKRFALISIALISIVFLGANFIPSIWDAFQFTGATAAVCIGFIFPAAITLRDRHGIATKKDKILSVFMIVLAVCSNMVAIYSDALGLLKKNVPRGHKLA